jgi:hypothetical protein
MLKCIIEYHHVGSFGDRAANPAHAIACCYDRNSRIESLVDERLVASVSAQYDRRMCASLEELTGKPRGHGSLPCASNAKVADAEYRHRKVVCGEDSAIVELSARADRGAIQRFSRS